MKTFVSDHSPDAFARCAIFRSHAAQITSLNRPVWADSVEKLATSLAAKNPTSQERLYATIGLQLMVRGLLRYG